VLASHAALALRRRMLSDGGLLARQELASEIRSEITALSPSATPNGLIKRGRRSDESPHNDGLGFME
jgi:hypothetical protein